MAKAFEINSYLFLSKRGTKFVEYILIVSDCLKGTGRNYYNKIMIGFLSQHL